MLNLITRGWGAEQHTAAVERVRRHVNDHLGGTWLDVQLVPKPGNGTLIRTTEPIETIPDRRLHYGETKSLPCIEPGTYEIRGGMIENGHWLQLFPIDDQGTRTGDGEWYCVGDGLKSCVDWRGCQPLDTNPE